MVGKGSGVIADGIKEMFPKELQHTYNVHRTLYYKLYANRLHAPNS